MRWVVGLLVLLASAHAGAADARWGVSWSALRDSAAPTDGNQRARRSSDLVIDRGEASSQLFFSHRYDILDLPAAAGVAAMTNGHVHRLAFGRAGWSDEAYWRVAPAVAVSSNVAKHPREFALGDLQLIAAFEQRIAGRASAGWLGLNADSRLGRYLVYPAARWIGRTDARTGAGAIMWQLGFPDSFVAWQWTPAWTARLNVGPDGGQWNVRDRDLEHRSRVQVRTWRAGAALRWSPGAAFALELTAGRSFATTLRYTLINGESVRLGVPDAIYFGAQVSMRL